MQKNTSLRQRCANSHIILPYLSIKMARRTVRRLAAAARTDPAHGVFFLLIGPKNTIQDSLLLVCLVLPSVLFMVHIFFFLHNLPVLRSVLCFFLYFIFSWKYMNIRGGQLRNLGFWSNFVCKHVAYNEWENIFYQNLFAFIFPKLIFLWFY